MEVAMTGQKDRYSTTEKLWKLDDDQLTTPRHDEIVIDILNNGENVFKKYKTPFEIKSCFEIYESYRYGKEREWQYTHTVYHNVSTLPEGDLYLNRDGVKTTFNLGNVSHLLDQSKDNINATIPKTKILSEIPLTARNGFLVGFLDVLLETPVVKDIDYILKEIVVSENYKYELHQIVSISENSVGIEVKPTIDSFGKTLRQLNTYREYFKGKLMLCTDDTRFKSAFESQNIPVITTSDIKVG